MARRRRAEVRVIDPDPRYNDLLVAKFVNNLMKGGKKGVAESLLYSAFNVIEEKTEQPGLEVFKKAVSNVQPILEVKSRRVGGATYQVPIEVSYKRKQALAFRWLISNATARSEKTMSDKLAGEFIAAAKNEGNSIKKKEDTHKMAEANKAFAHFRW